MRWGTGSLSQSRACTEFVGGRCLESLSPTPGCQGTEVVRGVGAALTCVQRTGLPQRSTRRCLPGAGARSKAAPRPAGRPCCARRPPRADPRRRLQPGVPARAASRPGRADPGSQRSGGRAGGRRARGGGARSRPRPAPPRGPPPLAPPLPTRKKPRGSGAPARKATRCPPEPGALRCVALLGAQCQFRGALPRVAKWGAEAGPWSQTQPGPKPNKPGLMMRGPHPLSTFLRVPAPEPRGTVHPCNKGFLSSERHCVQGTSPPLHILSRFNLQTTLGEVGTMIPILQREKRRPRHS